jgi:hypothetical protein
MKNIEVDIVVVAPSTNSIQVEWTNAFGEVEKHWLPLAENVKITFCRKGPATISTEDIDGKTHVTYCKSNAPRTNAPVGQSAFGSSPSNATTGTKKGFDTSDPIQQRMSALKFAGMVYETSKDEAKAKSLTDDALHFLENGEWPPRTERV